MTQFLPQITRSADIPTDRIDNFNENAPNENLSDYDLPGNTAQYDTLTIQMPNGQCVEISASLEQKIVLGRGATATDEVLYVDLEAHGALDLGVSRRHVTVWREPKGWWLQDMYSTNGTWLNRERLLPLTPRLLTIKSQVLMSHLSVHLFLPHRRLAGNVLVPVYQDNSSTTLPMTIISVEQDAMLQELLRMYLQLMNIPVQLHQFVSGEDALPLIEEKGAAVDLYLIDLSPAGKLGGLQLARKIRDLKLPGHIILSSEQSSLATDMLAGLKSEYYPKPRHILETLPQLGKYRLVNQTPTSVPEITLASKATLLAGRPNLVSSESGKAQQDAQPVATPTSAAIENNHVLNRLWQRVKSL